MKPKIDSTPMPPTIQHQIDVILLAKKYAYWKGEAKYWKVVCLALLGIKIAFILAIVWIIWG